MPAFEPRLTREVVMPVHVGPPPTGRWRLFHIKGVIKCALLVGELRAGLEAV